jgi:hypothetical protein
MKKRALGLAIVLLALAAGYALGDFHNRPRVRAGVQVVNFLLKEPLSGSISKKPYVFIKKKFEDSEGNLPFQEDWKAYYKNTPFVVVYNTADDYVLIDCKHKNCALTETQ